MAEENQALLPYVAADNGELATSKAVFHSIYIGLPAGVPAPRPPPKPHAVGGFSSPGPPSVNTRSFIARMIPVRCLKRPSTRL